MNEHTLPEDFSRWPASPFELLGVRPGVSDRDLRRAYTRLIRVYKPEQFPEQFRRIREAYEAARQFASFFATPDPETPADVPAPEDERSPDPRPVPATPEAGDNTGTPVVDHPVPGPRSLEEELDEAWDSAVDGDEARAYARLLELHDRHPERTDVCLRLYCLLSVAPGLDTRRPACVFLAQGLRQAGGSGPCHELYRREIETDPAEALTERFAGLLEAVTQPGLLATFVRWRWEAAGRQKRFDVIADDLPRLRTRLAVEQEEVWLRLLAAAADQLAWAPAAPADAAGLAECLHEAGEHEHLHLRCPDIFDRLENLERIATGWQSLRKSGAMPAALLELLARFWTRPFAEVRRSVAALLAAVAAAPAVWLGHLDRLKAVSPPLLSLFGQVLATYEETREPDADRRNPEELAVLARHFLEEYGGLRYQALRPRLLTFCLREFLEPDVLARVALARTVVLPPGWLNELVNDWPLRHVYRACALLWS
jgi:hypothetical protein